MGCTKDELTRTGRVQKQEDTQQETKNGRQFTTAMEVEADSERERERRNKRRLSQTSHIERGAITGAETNDKHRRKIVACLLVVLMLV